MIEEKVGQWLSRWRWRKALTTFLFGVLIGSAGIAILALTWVLCYIASLGITGSWMGYDHWFHTAFGLILIPLLFLGTARRSIDHSSEYSVSTGTATDKVVKIYLPKVGPGSNINPLAPDTAGTIGRTIANCLCIGPSVTILGLQTLRQAAQISRIHKNGCSAVIATLLIADRRMTFKEIVEAAPGINPVRVFSDLALVDGVLFLTSDPPGLSLSDRMKKGLHQSVKGL